MMPLPDVWGELLKNSVKAKFAFWGFSEVGLPLYGVLRSRAVRNHAAQSLQSRKEVGDLLGVVDAEPVVQ
jgi:hypothetical protein